MGKNTEREREREKSLSRHYCNQGCFNDKETKKQKKERMKSEEDMAVLSILFSPCERTDSKFTYFYYSFILFYLFIFLHSVF